MAKINEHEWHLVGREHTHGGTYRVDVEDARAGGDDGELVTDCTYMRAHLEVAATGERIWTSAVYPSADSGKRLHNAKNYRGMLKLAERSTPTHTLSRTVRTRAQETPARSSAGSARVGERGAAGMKYREIIKAVEDDGWRLASQKGSHRQYEHPTKPGKVTISGHPGEDVPPGTLNSILKQAGLKGR